MVNAAQPSVFERELKDVAALVKQSNGLIPNENWTRKAAELWVQALERPMKEVQSSLSQYEGVAEG